MRCCAIASAPANHAWSAAPIIDGQTRTGGRECVRNPARTAEEIGTVIDADAAPVAAAIDVALRAQEDWDAAGGEQRARVLERAATLFEEHTRRARRALRARGGQDAARCHRRSA